MIIMILKQVTCYSFLEETKYASLTKFHMFGTNLITRVKFFKFSNLQKLKLTIKEEIKIHKPYNPFNYYCANSHSL